MAISLSSFVDNLAEQIHKIKCKDCDCFLNMKVSMKIYTIYLINYVYIVIKTSQKRLTKNKKNKSKTYSSFLLVLITLFCC